MLELTKLSGETAMRQATLAANTYLEAGLETIKTQLPGLSPEATAHLLAGYMQTCAADYSSSMNINWVAEIGEALDGITGALREIAERNPK